MGLTKATEFISDFEPNIPKYFSKWFPGIPVQGCLFHYGKAILKMVTQNGMKKYYSLKSEEPTFGTFIRLILGNFDIYFGFAELCIYNIS